MSDEEDEDEIDEEEDDDFDEEGEGEEGEDEEENGVPGKPVHGVSDATKPAPVSTTRRGLFEQGEGISTSKNSWRFEAATYFYLRFAARKHFTQKIPQRANKLTIMRKATILVLKDDTRGKDRRLRLLMRSREGKD